MLPVLCLLPVSLASASVPSLQDRLEASAVVVEGGVAARVDTYLGRLERMGFSGAVLIADGAQILLSKGYGMANRALGTPMTPDTIVPLGSITKHFTAAAILKLEMDSKLTVEDPIGRFFGEVPESKATITVHQLLSHTAGFPESSGTALASSGRDDWVRRALATELVFEPGSEFGYSNVGYGLLAAIIEVASGRSYEDYLRAEVLLPAGMTSTGAELAKWDPGRVAHGYIDGVDTGTLLGEQGLGWSLIGAGGLQTSAVDMFRWSRALDEHAVLSADSLAKMTTPQAPMGRGGYGYGCGIMETPDGRLFVGHNGSNDVFSADFRRYPDEGVLIYAHANDADVYAFDVTPRIEQMVFGGEVAEPPVVVEMEPSVLARYAGEWRFDSGAGVRVEPDGAVLHVSSSDPSGAALVFPVPAPQAARRATLLAALGEGFERSFEGDFEPLHGLIDPYSPRAAFVEQTAEMLEDVVNDLGASKAVHTVPGRSRFGEVAVIAVLEMERGNRMIEYSFGDDEVGSIRFLREFPKRIARPISAEQFVSYDVATGESWGVRFVLEDDVPKELVLRDEVGKEHRAGR